jgi:hypothetical protein
VTQDYDLTPDDLAQAEQAARRFQATWWQGTSGTLAAWIILLIKERRRMATALEDANKALRTAVEARLAGAPIELPDSMAGYTLTPAEPAEEATFDEPEPVTQMTPEQLDAAWAGVTQRQAEMQAKIREPESAEPVARRVVPAAAAVEPGVTAKFGTGAVRSDTFEEFRYDLISPLGLREVARTCAEGAKKYSDFNWEKGMPVHDLLNHAIAHIYGFLSGDRSEPHLGHAAWNLLAAIHSNELWPQLNEGRLRAEGCRAPTCTKVQ